MSSEQTPIQSAFEAQRRTVEELAKGWVQQVEFSNQLNESAVDSFASTSELQRNTVRSLQSMTNTSWDVMDRSLPGDVQLFEMARDTMDELFEQSLQQHAELSETMGNSMREAVAEGTAMNMRTNDMLQSNLETFLRFHESVEADSTAALRTMVGQLDDVIEEE